MNLKFVWILLALLLPKISSAEDVAVFVGPYRMLWEDNADVGERATAVAEALQKGALSAGYSAKISGPCAEAACLEKALKEGFDEALFAETLATDAGYEFTVRRTGDRENHLSFTGAFVDATAFLERECAMILGEKKADEKNETSGEKGVPASDTQTPPAPLVDSRTGLHPSGFFTGLGLSVGFIGVFVGLDVSLHKRHEKLSQGDESLDYWNTSKNLQIANRVVFGLGVAAVLTTFVLAPLTDFKRRKKTALLFDVGADEDGGYLGVKGRF